MNAVSSATIMRDLERLQAELAEVTDPNGAPRPGEFLDQYIEDLKNRIEEHEQMLKQAEARDIAA
jgi:hypothetical protein